MGWNRETAEKRIEKNDFSHEEVKVVKLTKGMYFSNLPKKEVRNCESGTHTYVDVSNFNEIASNCGDDKEKQKKVLRALSVKHKVLNSMVKDQSSEIMQMQSSRSHIINYRPFNDDEQLVINSVSSAISYISYLYEVFNPIFKELDDFRCCIGIAHGQFLVTNLGADGKREVISLGLPANQGAKILNGHGNISITLELYNLLPEDLQDIFEKKTIKGKTIYTSSSVRWSKYPSLQEKYAQDFDKEALESLTKDYRDSLPINEINISGVNKKVCFDDLSERNVKRFKALIIYADLDGFSSYIEKAFKNDELKEIIPVIHGAIAEFQSAVADLEAIPVQVRGDCLISIAHLPTNSESESKRIKQALQVAVALQSSMDVLNSYFKDYPDLKVAVGIDYGNIMATRLGKNGEKEKVIIGIPAIESESLQQHFCKGDEIAISKDVYKKLDYEPIKKHFSEAKEGHFYSKQLTFDKLDEDLKKSSENRNRTASLGSGIATVGTATHCDPAPAYINQARHCWEDGHEL